MHAGPWARTFYKWALTVLNPPPPLHFLPFGTPGTTLLLPRRTRVRTVPVQRRRGPPYTSRRHQAVLRRGPHRLSPTSPARHSPCMHACMHACTPNRFVGGTSGLGRDGWREGRGFTPHRESAARVCVRVCGRETSRLNPRPAQQQQYVIHRWANAYRLRIYVYNMGQSATS